MAKLSCFVIMPFSADFDAVYGTIHEAAASAIPGERIDCHWLKDVRAAGRITDDIVDALGQAVVCIADVTGSNPNVMWETGYAMALGRPTLLIGQNVDRLPFDLRVHRILPYSPQSLSDLGSQIAEGLRQTLSRYEIKTIAQPQPARHPGTLNIVITGSRTVHEARAQRRLASLVQPYLKCDATWYCGSSGAVDDLAMQYLVDRGEQVVAVAVHRWGMSEGSRNLVSSGSVPMIDSSLEAIPRGLAGSERDVLFCTKADLVILLWDGQSHGTRRLIDYLTANGKSLLVGFI